MSEGPTSNLFPMPGSQAAVFWIEDIGFGANET
jgi:hypothetical protein